MDTERLLVDCVKTMGYTSIKREQKEVIMQRMFLLYSPLSLVSVCSTDVCLRFIQKKTSIVVVVSPLIALMNDQVESFLAKGVSAVRVDSCEDNKKIIDGEYQLVFISPEAVLLKRKWRRMLCLICINRIWFV